MYFKEPDEKELGRMGICAGTIVTACCAVLLVGTAFGPWIMGWVEKIVWG
jgi:hypothetical protein